MKKITRHWKAVFTFVALLCTNLAQIKNIPQTPTEWFTTILTTVGGTMLVWVKTNTTVVPEVAENQSVKLVEKKDSTKV